MLDSELKHEMGRRIRAVRRTRGWSRAQLGERVNKTAVTIAGIENGHSFMRVQDLRELCRALRISPTYILLLTDKPEALET